MHVFGAVCDICEDSETDDDDDDAFESELFDLTQNGDSDDPLGEDAAKGIRQEHLETILTVDLLYCDDLGAPPDLIEQMFSCVLGDIFHGMNRAKVPVKRVLCVID